MFSVAQVKHAALGLALSLTLLASGALVGAVATGSGPAAPRSPAPPAGPAPGIAGRAPVAYSGAVGRVALGGTWTYKPDPGNIGLARRWFAQSFAGRSVTLPYSPNAWPVTGPRGTRNFKGSVGWYRTSFSVPTAGAYAIRFESVNFRAGAWLDGKFIGNHHGVYMPFELRPTLRAQHQYRLVVRADWRDPVPGMKRLGWHRGWFNYGGINREVTIRLLQPSEIEAPVIETNVARDGSVARVTLRLRVQNRAAAREITPWATLARADQSLAVAFPTRRVGRGGRAVFTAHVDVPSPALWSPVSPALYDLALFVPGEGGYQARVGLRQLSIRAHHPYLNGRPLFLYGAAIHEDARGHGDALTAADMDRIVGRLKRIGANATRAQHPLNPALLDRLDAAGILVWQEIGPWDSPGNWLEKTKSLQREGLARVHASFEQLALHPSIFAWNLGNEVGAAGHPGQPWFIDAAARWLKANDPGRLTALDVWGILLPTHRSLMYAHIDALGTTSYFGWYEEPFAKAPRIRQLIAERAAYMHRLFPAKVMVASEFGGEGNRMNAPWSHGGLKYQAWLLRQTIDAYVKLSDMSGALVWNLQDFGVNPDFGGGSILTKVRGIKLLRGLNQKGLFDSMGRPKPAVAAVAAAFQRARLARG